MQCVLNYARWDTRLFKIEYRMSTGPCNQVYRYLLQWKLSICLLFLNM